MKKLLIATGTCLLVLLSGCKNNRTDDDNLEKLLERQAVRQEVQQQSLEQMERLKDSLASQKKSLLDQRDSKDLQIRQLENNQQQLADQLKEEEAKAVSSQKADLEKQIILYEDSISNLKIEIGGLDSQLDSLEKSLDFFDLQETRVESRLESGIEEIDQRMTQRENRKQMEIKRIGLLQKRVQVSDKKLEAYRLEKQMYVDERDQMLRDQASEEELQPYEEKISDMDSVIAGEMGNKKSIEQEITQSQQYIAETDDIIEDLQNQIKDEYSKQEVIDSFIAAEKKRLNKELEQIKNNRNTLLAQQESISGELARTGVQIDRLNKDVELIRNKKMSDILESQAEMEKAEASLAEEEMDLFLAAPGMPLVPLMAADTSNEELQTVLDLGVQLDSLNELIQQEKAEIAKTRQELSEKRAEVAEKRARFGRTVGITAIVLIVAGIALLGLFYYLGRRSRKS
jgi:chromosome segregation ATPase